MYVYSYSKGNINFYIDIQNFKAQFGNQRYVYGTVCILQNDSKFTST